MHRKTTYISHSLAEYSQRILVEKNAFHEKHTYACMSGNSKAHCDKNSTKIKEHILKEEISFASGAKYALL